MVEEEIDRLLATGSEEITDERLRIMKRIHKKLRVLILKVELAMIERKKEKGNLSPKQARTENAKVKKRWLYKVRFCTLGKIYLAEK